MAEVYEYSRVDRDPRPGETFRLREYNGPRWIRLSDNDPEYEHLPLHVAGDTPNAQYLGRRRAFLVQHIGTLGIYPLVYRQLGMTYYVRRRQE